MRSPSPHSTAWSRELAEIGRRTNVHEAFWDPLVADALYQSALNPQRADDVLLDVIVADRLPEGVDALRIQSELRSANDLFVENQPSFHQEMELRSQPLKQQWLARGPGFLRQLDERVGCWNGEKVTLFGVMPNRGGWGTTVPTANAMLIEWLLTNVEDRLPEITRLAWLVTRLRIAQCGQQAATFDAFDITMQIATRLEWLSDNDGTRHLAKQLWSIRSPGSTNT